jgi:SAM-dependent methyltransferase
VRRGAAAPGGEPYERLGPLYDRWCAGVDHDVAFYVLACEGATGPIVELGAGSGRIAVELARHGHRVVALDASPAMLAQARRRAHRLGVDDLLETVLGDLRDPPALPRSDRVIAPFRTFMHLAGDAERRRALTAAASLLAEEGRFVFDVFEPSAADIRSTHDRWIARREGISERPLWYEAERRLELDVRLPGRLVGMTLEWRSAEEWRALCLEAGLTVLSSEAGFGGDPLGDQQGDQVYICALA